MPNVPEFGDTSAGVWLSEVYQDCLREVGVGRSSVDIDLLGHKIRAEWKNAQVAMQLLAYELKKELGGLPVSQATGLAQTHRLLLGSVFITYCVMRHLEAGHSPDKLPEEPPPELGPILRMHPLIMESGNFIASENNVANAALSRQEVAEATQAAAHPR